MELCSFSVESGQLRINKIVSFSVILISCIGLSWNLSEKFYLLKFVDSQKFEVEFLHHLHHSHHVEYSIQYHSYVCGSMSH